MPASICLGPEELRSLRWVSGGMLIAGAVLSRLPAGAGVPCPLRLMTGVPCPLCGMTTSVRSIFGGDLAVALTANPFGLLVLTAAVGFLLWRPKGIRVPRALLGAIAAASWGYQLWRFGLI
ncbi:MAG: DUF2752 domain-containing protein [Acidimicrobiales bacterium]